jgi:hypothetical protein
MQCSTLLYDSSIAGTCGGKLKCCYRPRMKGSYSLVASHLAHEHTVAEQQLRLATLHGCILQAAGGRRYVVLFCF